MIPIKTPEEIRIMREGGRILAKIMKVLEKEVKPGITTKELDKRAEGLIFSASAEGYGGSSVAPLKRGEGGDSGAKPAFKGYKGFPNTLCVAINEEIVHAVPSDRVLKQGDIISLDLGLLYPAPEKTRCGAGKSFYVDMAVTLPVGKVEPEAGRLIRVCKKALKRGIKKIRPGNTFGDIGNTIQRYVEGQGFSVIRDLCGHGIGKELHEDPQVLNYGKRRAGPELAEGMVFCLEPMITIGDYKIKQTVDNFGYQTADNSLSAHFEHTIAVTKTGCEILTQI